MSEVVRERRLNFAAQCSRRQNEPVSELVFWMPSQGTRAQGRPRLTYPKLLSQDTGLEPQELLNLMQDRILELKFIMVSTTVSKLVCVPLTAFFPFFRRWRTKLMRCENGPKLKNLTFGLNLLLAPTRAHQVCIGICL